MSELRELIEELVTKQIPMSIKVGVVISVDTINDTCEIEPMDGPNHPAAKLRAVEDSNFDSRVVIYPKVGSKVVYLFVNNDPNNVIVVSVSDFESIIIQNSPSSFKLNIAADGKVVIDSPEIKFNNGPNGGLVKSEPVSDSFNDVINVINVLKDIFTSWTPVPNDGGAALKALAAAWASSMMSNVAQTAYENSDIQH